MARFQYNDFEVFIGEMDRIGYLKAVKEVQDAITNEGDDLDRIEFAADVDWFLIKHSRILFKKEGRTLENGTHLLDDVSTITLPLTREGYDALPLSLSTKLAQQAQEVNAAAVAFFTLVWKTVNNWMSNSVITSADAPLNDTKTESDSQTMTITGA